MRDEEKIAAPKGHHYLVTSPPHTSPPARFSQSENRAYHVRAVLAGRGAEAPVEPPSRGPRPARRPVPYASPQRSEERALVSFFAQRKTGLTTALEPTT